MNLSTRNSPSLRYFYTGSSASCGYLGPSGFIDLPGSSGSIARPGSSISQSDSGFSGEHSPSFATNGSYGHHSQPESFCHLSKFAHYALPSPSYARGHPLEISSTSQRSDTSEICQSVGLTANGNASCPIQQSRNY